MHRCKRCDEHVEDDERAVHSASEVHQSNGGSAEVDEADYEADDEEDDGGTRGMSKTR